MATPAEAIRVGDVVRALESRPELTECVGNPEVCMISTDCVTRQIWARATESIFRELDAIHERYSDVKPYVSAAAVVFALTAADAAAWGPGR